MSDATDLRIVEMLHDGSTYRDIQKALHVSAERIGHVKNDFEKGIIAIGEDGKAVLAQPAAKEIEDIHAEVMGVVTKAASRIALQNAEEDYALGNEIRQYWSLKAQEIGTDLRGFVRAALIFYDDYRERIKDMEEKLEVADGIADTLKRDLVRVRKLELYYQFVRYCLWVRSQGLNVTQNVVNAFWQDLTRLEKGDEQEIVTGGRGLEQKG